jgi:hypothetical protein
MSSRRPAFFIGQPVIISSERWTPNGWMPATETGLVLTPSVMRHQRRGFVEVWRGSGRLPEVEVYPREAVSPA